MRRVSGSARLVATAIATLLTTTVSVTAGVRPAVAQDGTRAVLGFSVTASAVTQSRQSVLSGKPVGLRLADDGDAPTRNLRVQISTAGLAGTFVVATGEAAGNYPCTPDGSVITCLFDQLAPHTVVKRYFMLVAVVPGTPVGAVGTFGVSVTADNADPVAGRSDLAVAPPGEDLVVWDVTRSNVAPGSTISVYPILANGGDRTANGVVMTISSLNTRYFPVVGRDLHCYPDPAHGYLAVCEFPDPVPPGYWKDLTPPVELGVSPHVPGPATYRGTFALYGMDTGRALLERARAAAGNPPRSAAPVRLTPAAAPSAVEVDPGDNTALMEIGTTDNPVDLAALPASVRGPAHQPLPVSIGVRDNGPADTESRADALPGAVVVTAPSGTVFSALPRPADAECLVAVDGRPDPTRPPAPGGRSYWCALAQRAGFLAAGATQRLSFQLTIEGTDIGTDGTVTALPGRLRDADPTNNTAPLTAAIGPPQSPSPGPTGPTATPAPGSGGTGAGAGALPATGGTVGPLAGGGAGVLLLGAALVVLGRRHPGRWSRTGGSSGRRRRGA